MGSSASFWPIAQNDRDFLFSANPEPDPDARIDRLTLKGEIPSLLKRPEGCEFHSRCPFVQERCRSEVPAAAGPDSHRFTCHFPLTQ